MRPVPVFAALALAMAATPAVAMMLPVPLDEAVRTAEAIVHARVVERVSAWDPARRFIHTDVTLEVLDTWKGALAKDARVTVRVIGGEVDGVGTWQEHEPRFADREEAVLLLSSTPDAVWVVQHLEQGKLHVESGEIHDSRGRVTSLAGFKSAVSRFLRTPSR